MITHARGIDIHRYNADGQQLDGPVYDQQQSVHFHAFVMPRVSYGLRIDRTFLTNLAAIHNTPVRMGWHFFTNHSWTWKEQADFYGETVRDGEKETGVSLHRHWVDFEPERNTPALTIADADDCRRMVDRLRNSWGLTVGYYSRINIWNPLLAKVLPEGEEAWIAQYPFARGSWDTPAARAFLKEVYEYQYDLALHPGHPDGATTVLWQLSADTNNQGAANGVFSRDVDMDWYHKPEDHMLKWAGVPGPTDPVDPAPPPIVIPPTASIDQLVAAIKRILDHILRLFRS